MRPKRRPRPGPLLAGLLLLAAAGFAADAGAITINVEVDWLVAGDHDHLPPACELIAVQDAFARNGHTLNIEISNAITETAGLEVIDFFSPGSFDNGEWAALEAAHRDHAVGTGWHYAIIGHNYSRDGVFTNSSGIAELFGDEFLVSVGSFGGDVGYPFSRSGTFMHELGHNLGLFHAGNQSEGIVSQYKPNYPSVMTYRYQLLGLRNVVECQGLATPPAPFFDLDYSHGLLPALDETALDESVGMGLGPVDWDCSGSALDVVSRDVSTESNWCTASGPLSALTDYDDWSSITSLAREPGATSPPEVVSCASPADLPDLLGARGVPTCAAPDPCESICGNGVLDPGEECDGAADLACPGACLADCTCGTCDAQPRTGCITGPRAVLGVRKKGETVKDTLKWKLGNGAALEQADLGDPTSTATYSLCIYDEDQDVASLAGRLRVSPGAGWDDQSPRGMRYLDKAAAADGVRKIQLRTGPDGKSKAVVRARGSGESWPTAFDAAEFFALDAVVTVQLVNDETATCWTTGFSSARKNSPSTFKASIR